MRTCKIDGCNKKVSAKNLCAMHYMRVRKNGDPYCLRIEHHGMEKTSEYKSWQGMKERCYRKNNLKYPRYGGRGIIVCAEWKHSFITFYKYMGDKPFKGAQIDRINNDGNYEPSNCRWVTNTENMRNSSCTKLTMEKAIEIRKLYKSGKYYQYELAKIYDVTQSAINAVTRNKTWI